ncbi:hypothetical protein JD844_009882 [Phrynosoma platyrhinos]|uniref:Condensin complex subunit 1 C-terminal domain-containing protein n=1 Tax=Phrynosoma platyrhinos TaxID=52577 RepID=A0ABQ7TFY6_PHRPL|nr:hypothetical protein JD844_009882 [Phrynosoma platyrhinos]
MISTEFCDTHLRLFFTMMEKSTLSSVRANLMIAAGDLAIRFPNQVEPWTPHLYARLRDPCQHVRKTAALVMTHLILKDMVKVKGQVSEMATLLIDPEEEIVRLALNFFTELSSKDRPEPALPSHSRFPSPVLGPSSAVLSPPALEVVSPVCPPTWALVSDSESEGEIREEVPLLAPETSTLHKDRATLSTEVEDAPLDPETGKILRENPNLVFDSLTGRFLMQVDPRTHLSRPSTLRVQAQVHRVSPSSPPVPLSHPRHRSPSRCRLSRSRSASPQAPSTRDHQVKHHRSRQDCT